ncbi:hypothetical protein GF357_00115, partial [Candidatus Dojkabacteria bacterium]|nr:hypothetical protein [Candidatus Dojkabacteria bacterium]
MRQIQLPKFVIVLLSIISIVSTWLYYGYEPAYAQETRATFSFQGKIVVKNTGINIGTGSPACVAAGADSCNFRISYYDSASGGVLLWQEDFSNIEIGEYDGIFNLALGEGSDTGAGSSASFTDTFADNPSTYLHILFDANGDGFGGGDDQSFTDSGSRMAIRAVPYATYAQNSASWSRDSGDGEIYLTNLTDEVGIGTDSPD